MKPRVIIVYTALAIAAILINLSIFYFHGVTSDPSGGGTLSLGMINLRQPSFSL